nr:hypothetical protein Iba_chr12cCG16000 [Ipomoea batatas]
MLSICQPFWYSGVGMAVIHPNEEPHSPSPWEREWGSRNRDGDKDYALIFSTAMMICETEELYVALSEYKLENFGELMDKCLRYSILVMEVECSE